MTICGFIFPIHGGGVAERAISVETEWREGYAWLNIAEAVAFAVRQDDPAVIHCDEHWRRERVVPAAWHVLGARW